MDALFLDTLKTFCSAAATVERYELMRTRETVLSIRCACPVKVEPVQRKVTDVAVMVHGLHGTAWDLLDELCGRHAPTLAEMTEWGWFNTEEG